ncbi:hypothetical protein [Legionella longbeachae]|uniref:hypothetical protein n=1 Tax=Legionella longbeachae TaxID=450 RepID=UPI00124684D1|nr:hypothetical protein [Legionella longbeachae]QEY52916.1 hypothetical protein FQU71_17725 [Legionella longbeachae]
MPEENINSPRTPEEFIALRDELLNQITEINAAQLYELSKNLIIEKLCGLNVNDIREVEDLYIIVALFTNTASYIAAQQKAIAKNIAFDEACHHIGLDDINPILVAAFEDHPGVELILHKIKEIDDKYKPGKEVWAGLHARIEAIADYFAIHPVPPREDIVPVAEEKESLDNLMLYLYRKSLKAFEAVAIPHQDQYNELFARAANILKQVQEIAGEHPEHLSQNDLKDLNDVLICANATLLDCNEKPKSMKHAQELTDLAQRVSGKPSPGWKALGISLLTCACAALVVIGVLAAIPSGGSSLLLTAIGSVGLVASIGVGAGVATTGLLGAASLFHGSEKGLAREISEFKKELSNLRQDLEKVTEDDTPSP